MISVMLLLVCPAFAVPSKQQPIQVTAPDGSIHTVIPVGDEHDHHYIDAEGNVVEWLTQGNRPKSTPMMKKRIAAPVNSEPCFFPTRGELPFLAILVEFADLAFSFDDAQEEFDAMLNQRGYDRYDGFGSALDYYIENSMGEFKPHFDVVGPVKLSESYRRYGKDWEENIIYMVKEACLALDDEIDFSRYDLDNDGIVDNIYFFYAGLGSNDGGDPNTIWPHAWSVVEIGETLILDGVQIDAYACSSELDGKRKPNGIGTFCHEFAHILGLPDLYNTSFGTVLHPASWSLMASGSYNGDGRKPPLLSAYERYELGWLEYDEISYPRTVSLPHLKENVAMMIPTERANEYFVFENRQPEGWDSSLPGHGLLVWHIDYDFSAWDNNTVNNRAGHQRVDIVEANNATSHIGDAGFTFPGASNVTSFTSETTPALKSWEGIPIDLPVTEITEGDDGIIRFLVAGGKEPVGVVSDVTVKEVAMESCLLEWKPAQNATRYFVSVREDVDDPEAKAFEVESESTSCLVEGLWPGKRYLATVCGADIYERGKGATVSIEMPEPDFSHSSPAVLPATEITESGFTANWEELDGAESYSVTVSRIDTSYPEPFFTGFDNSMLPEGWVISDQCAWNKMTSTCGLSAPSLRMNGNGAALATSAFKGDISEVSFFLKTSRKGSMTSLVVRGTDNSGVEHDLATIKLDSFESDISISVDRENIRSLAFVLIDPRNEGVLAYLDDVKISTVEKEISLVEGWSSREVGKVSFVRVDALAPSSEYSYRVMASNSLEHSVWSEPVLVTTDAPAGIGEVGSMEEEMVDVYSSVGILMKKEVRREEALQDLPRGIYIVGQGKIYKKIYVE